ncbi:expressed unknown protein [Seminavis robusta]|uniref:Uncharacterized protein n=1 Tax=Seminavis robusta TaxID=568900 RepID=A0A9N8DF32_9STRA|nr:expressed unknown protein [Seminavis robusta]|eukprot:Sro63_g035840.1 n/a (471) ;mRNA; r:71079-72491
MVANVRRDDHHGTMELWQQGMDPRLVVPLCIRENRLDHEFPDPPGNPAKTVRSEARRDSSPTAVADMLDHHPFESDVPGSDTTKPGMKKKKKKKTSAKTKLFRKCRKRSSAADDEDIDKKEALKREALNLKRIQEEEDADIAKLRQEEEESPKLDMLAHYPLTIMEEVLSIPIPEPVECEDDAEELVEFIEEEPEVVEDPEEAVVDLGRFEEQVHSLRLSQMDLRLFLSHPTLFARMQKELRDDGVITDETLRQKLHILCRKERDNDDIDISECRDIFSEPARKGRGWNSNLPLAYRRMNESFTEIDWKKEIEEDPTLSREDMKTRSKWSDRKLLHLVSNYSQKGRDSYHTEFQDGVEENDMVAYDQNLIDGVDLLTYCVHDLVPIVQEQEVFSNLQKELRKIGAVTNEVLKQGLHFYVRDVRLQKEREEAAMRAMEEKACPEDQDDLRRRGGSAKRQPLLTKLRLRARK